MTTPAPASFRPRRSVLPLALVVLVVMFTLASAAANLIPSPPRRTLAQWRRDEVVAAIERRRTRIAELRRAGDSCHPASAHELARLLVMDGQWSGVRTFADDYGERCGADPVVTSWRNAPRPHRAS